MGSRRSTCVPADVLALIVGDASADPVLRELVSGPNLDADRMDYLLRDAYFTGVAGGTYDAEQLIESLRVLEVDGRPQLGVDGRGVVALESFVLARYMMFATVYFHHTTRAFERVLQDVLRRLWPNPRALDDIDEFLAWDDFRVIDALRAARGRGRASRCASAARCTGSRRSSTPSATCARFSSARMRCASGGATPCGRIRRSSCCTGCRSAPPVAPTVRVRLMGRIVDARVASDVIAKLSGKAYWRKLFVRTDAASVAESRAICADIIATGGQPRLL